MLFCRPKIPRAIMVAPHAKPLSILPISSRLARKLGDKWGRVISVEPLWLSLRLTDKFGWALCVNVPRVVEILMSVTADSDQELHAILMQVANGNEQALAALYKKLSRRIYAFSLRRVSDPNLAEEVVVETMYEVWRSAQTFNERSQVTTWILGIARYKTLDKLRQRGQRETISDESVLNAIVDESATAYDILTQQQQTAQVARCIETLPSDQRECLHLTFYEDMSIHEIAEIQAIPGNTVKTRLFHARRKMKECLERQIRWVGDL